MMDIETYNVITSVVETYAMLVGEKGEISPREHHLISGLIDVGQSEDSANLRGQVVLHLVQFLTD